MPRILLVEDDPDALEVMSLMLAAHEVEAVSGVNEALAALEARAPDLIVTDLRLGERTGLELVELVGRMGLDIPTLVVTGFVEADQRPTGIIKGYLTKPFDSASLRSLVDETLKQGS